MATTALTLTAERWLDEVMLQATVADAAVAPIVENFTLPAGLGDVAVMNMFVTILVVGTVPVTATIDRGVRAIVVSNDAATHVDNIGVAEFYATGGNGAAFDRFDAFIDSDALALVRQGEQIVIAGPEMDAGATGDVRVVIKAVRVRPIEGTARGPVRLVR